MRTTPNNHFSCTWPSKMCTIQLKHRMSMCRNTTSLTKEQGGCTRVWQISWMKLWVTSRKCSKRKGMSRSVAHVNSCADGIIVEQSHCFLMDTQKLLKRQNHCTYLTSSKLSFMHSHKYFSLRPLCCYSTSF